MLGSPTCWGVPLRAMSLTVQTDVYKPSGTVHSPLREEQDSVERAGKKSPYDRSSYMSTKEFGGSYMNRSCPRVCPSLWGYPSHHFNTQPQARA